MRRLRELEAYSDDDGNVIQYTGAQITKGIDVRFRGSNNVLVVADEVKIVDVVVDFFGDNGRVEIGPTSQKRTGLRFKIRVGHRSSVTIGENVGSQSSTFIAASEGESVSIGKDCMLSSHIEMRTDDSHGIYDVRSKKRINPAKSIHIGDHVWIGKHVAILGGVSIGSGSVIGFRSIVTKDVPNNCIVAGAPARVVRKDIAWERPRTADKVPGQLSKPRNPSLDYWNPTVGDEEPLLSPVHKKQTLTKKQTSALKKRIRKITPDWVIRLRNRLR